FNRYGDLAQARKIAKAIVLRRAERPVETAADLMNLTGRWAEKGRENKFYATLFQALRMEVNQEEAVLMQFLQQAAEVLKPGGRLVVLSYHSVEDRLVKHFIKSGNADGVVEKDFYGNPLSPFKAVNRKVIQASEEELARNPRARSAKMRVAEKV
ncbi:MAG: 16S rRNA (cytosine(1402)-N(4))-methyltransferase, partial [Bacteroidales bacterium]|nr:16S rRNA (cytosine(1402)-N(4))-methyltransferase [Bacteroidales bacterium]